MTSTVEEPKKAKLVLPDDTDDPGQAEGNAQDSESEAEPEKAGATVYVILAPDGDHGWIEVSRQEAHSAVQAVRQHARSNKLDATDLRPGESVGVARLKPIPARYWDRVYGVKVEMTAALQVSIDEG